MTLLASLLECYLIIMANKCNTGTIKDLLVQMLISPLILAAKTAAIKEDNPTRCQEAMNGPYAEEYWKAAQIEIETLERIKSWTVVPPSQDQQIDLLD